MQEILKRIHTIKGNARAAHLSDIASIAHNLEDAMKDHDRGSILVHSSALVSELREYQNALGLFFASDSVVLETVLDIVSGLRPDIESRLKASAIPFGSISVEDGFGVASPPIKEILLHGLTNAVDHGFILPRRKGRGDLPPARLEVEASREGNLHRIVIRDNGVGIDWLRLQEISKDRGFTPLPGRPVSDIVFLDSVSTAYGISLTSGRGQGMGAIKSAAKKLNGDVLLVDNDKIKGSMLIVSWSERLA